MSNATSSSNPPLPLRCTCGTIPIIDLSSYDQQNKTDGVNQEGNKEYQSWIESTRSSIVSACQSHGCFHLVINTNTDDNDNNEDEEVMVKPSKHKQSSVSSLTHLSPSWKFATKNPNEVIEPLFDTKIEEMTQPQRLSVYRGRNAESGKVGTNSADDNDNNEEPKQSWEFRRCHRTSFLKGEEDSTDSTLCQWTMALHSIAVRLSDILNLPNGMIVRNDDDDDDGSCNSDLLRVFRYDPIDPPQPQDDDKNDESDIVLGSSPHTDWGTMTIVWQDGIGGLQMYCHEHDQWCPVVPPPSSSSDNQLHCFVHVGDFLSLSSPPVMSSCSNSTNSHNAVVVEPRWKSPRHRVVSPTGTKPRYSLVYFLYPRLGMTLRHAQTQMANNGDCFGGGIIHDDDPLPMNNNRSYPSSVLEKYSLLHNQSVVEVEGPSGGDNDNDDSILQTRFQEMSHIPFEEVVAQKWAQVQRS